VRVWEADPVFTAARIFSSPRVFVLLSLGASAHFLFPSARFSFPRLSAWIHSAPGSFFAFFFCHPRRSARASCLPILVCRSSAGVESVFPARWIHLTCPRPLRSSRRRDRPLFVIPFGVSFRSWSLLAQLPPRPLRVVGTQFFC
jgi:hypothetical protein